MGNGLLFQIQCDVLNKYREKSILSELLENRPHNLKLGLYFWIDGHPTSAQLTKLLELDMAFYRKLILAMEHSLVHILLLLSGINSHYFVIFNYHQPGIVFFLLIIFSFK